MIWAFSSGVTSPSSKALYSATQTCIRAKGVSLPKQTRPAPSRPPVGPPEKFLHFSIFLLDAIYYRDNITLIT
jgi:hypothetical protein